MIQPLETNGSLSHDELYNLEYFLVHESSRFANRSIKDIGFGEKFSGSIMGIERGESRILNPESSVVLRPGDLIWIFGHRKKIKELRKG